MKDQCSPDSRAADADKPCTGQLSHENAGMQSATKSVCAVQMNRSGCGSPPLKIHDPPKWVLSLSLANSRSLTKFGGN